MKDNQNEHNMGEQIMDALSDALQGGDFSHLNRLVSQSVNNVINEVGRQAQEQIYRQTQTREQIRRQEKAQREEHARRQAQQMYQQRTESAKNQNNSFQNMPQTTSWQTAPVPIQPKQTVLLPLQLKKVGNVSNVLYQVFGGIGFGITMLVTFHSGDRRYHKHRGMDCQSSLPRTVCRYDPAWNRTAQAFETGRALR